MTTPSTPAAAPDWLRGILWSNDPLWQSQRLAEAFHEAYERLSDQNGYETRPDTRTFDAYSPNGKTMIAVCGEMLPPLLAAISSAASPAFADRSFDAGPQCKAPFGVCPDASICNAKGPCSAAASPPSEPMLNGLTEAETDATASVSGIVGTAAQASQEPMFYAFKHNKGNGKFGWTFHTPEEYDTAYRDTCLEIIKLYAAPPPSSSQPGEAGEQR